MAYGRAGYFSIDLAVISDYELRGEWWWRCRDRLGTRVCWRGGAIIKCHSVGLFTIIVARYWGWMMAEKFLQSERRGMGAVGLIRALDFIQTPTPSYSIRSGLCGSFNLAWYHAQAISCGKVLWRKGALEERRWDPFHASPRRCASSPWALS